MLTVTALPNYVSVQLEDEEGFKVVAEHISSIKNVGNPEWLLGRAGRRNAIVDFIRKYSHKTGTTHGSERGMELTPEFTAGN